MNEFEKFLRSPFYNNHSTVVKLFCGLKKYYPGFDNEKLTKQLLFSMAGNKSRYDDRLFRKYISRLNKLAEEYMNILHKRSEGISKEINVLNDFIKRDLKEVYSKKLNAIWRTHLPESNIDDEYLLMMYRFYLTQHNFESVKNPEKPNNDFLLKALFNLEGYFLFNSYAIINQIISNNYSFRINQDLEPILGFYTISGIEKFMKKIKKFPALKNERLVLMMELLINTFKMNKSENGYAAYSKLKRLIKENFEKLTPRMLYYIIQNMNVYCIISKKVRKADLSKDLFENYKLLIDKNIFNSSEIMNITLLDFKQILNSALKNNEAEWAENFVKNNSGRLTEIYGSNIIYFSNANLLFHRSNYNESLNNLLKINNEPIAISIDIYVLKLKIFFHQGYLDSSLYVADSLRHFISGNKKLSDNLKTSFLNFIKYYKKISQCIIKRDNESLLRHYSSLEKSVNTREKDWMLKVIRERLK